MMDEAELMRMVVRLLGDGSLYTKMCEDAVKSTQQAANKITTFGKIIEGTKKTLESFGGALTKVGQGMRSIGTLASVGITAPITALAGVATNEFNQFESSLSRMKGLVGLSDETIAGFREEILKLGPAVGKAPDELAKAMENITSSGVQGEAALETLNVTARAAAGGLGEVRSVSDTVTSAMNAYGVANLSATKATDILVAAVREGKAEADTFAPVLGNVLPIANEMGISFDEAAGSIAYLTLATGSAATAATQYQNILAQTLKLNPAKEAGKNLTALGIDVRAFQDSVGEKGLLPSLMKLKEQLASTGHSLKDAFPDVQAMTAALQLTGANSAKAASVLENVANAAGSVDKAFEAAAETTQFKLNQAMAEMKTILIELGEIIAPIFARFTSGLGSIMQMWKQLTPASKQWVVTIAAAAAAIGPLLVGFGTLIAIVGSAISGLGAMVGVVGTLISLINPWTIGLAAVGAGLVYIFTKTELAGKVVQWFGKQWEAVTAYIGPAIESIKKAVEKGDLELAFKIALNQIKLAFFEGTFEMHKNWIKFTVDVQNFWFSATHTIRRHWQAMTVTIAALGIAAIGFLTGESEEQIKDKIQNLKDMHKQIMKDLKIDKDKAVANIDPAAEKSIKALKDNIDALKLEKTKLATQALAPPKLPEAVEAQLKGSGLINEDIKNQTDEAAKHLAELDKKAKIKIEMKFDAAQSGTAEAASRIASYMNNLGINAGAMSAAPLKKKNYGTAYAWESLTQHQEMKVTQQIKDKEDVQKGQETWEKMEQLLQRAVRALETPQDAGIQINAANFV